MTASIPLDTWWLGVVSFAAAWCAHALLWHWAPPRHDIRALFALVLALPLGAFVALLPWRDAIAPLLTHGLLAANYLAVYPALQASSPTLRLLCWLARAPKGLSLEELEAHWREETPLEDRLEDLERGGLVLREGATIRLARSGRRLADFFVFYRRWLGLPRGEG